MISLHFGKNIIEVIQIRIRSTIQYYILSIYIKEKDIYDSDFILCVAQLVLSYAMLKRKKKKSSLFAAWKKHTGNVNEWLVSIYSQQYILPARKTLFSS